MSNIINKDVFARKIADTYAWDYEFENGICYATISNMMGDVWQYQSAEELIGDWYITINDTYLDSIKNGGDGYWSQEELEFAKKCYEM